METKLSPSPLFTVFFCWLAFVAVLAINYNIKGIDPINPDVYQNMINPLPQTTFQNIAEPICCKTLKHGPCPAKAHMCDSKITSASQAKTNRNENKISASSIFADLENGILTLENRLKCVLK